MSNEAHATRSSWGAHLTPKEQGAKKKRKLGCYNRETGPYGPPYRAIGAPHRPYKRPGTWGGGLFRLCLETGDRVPWVPHRMALFYRKTKTRTEKDRSRFPTVIQTFFKSSILSLNKPVIFILTLVKCGLNGIISQENSRIFAP